MIITDKEKRKLARMRKPVSQINRLYGPFQLGQYLVARLIGDGKAKSIEDLKDFIALCAQETIEDLEKWFETPKTKSKGKRKTISKSKAKQETKETEVLESDLL